MLEIIEQNSELFAIAFTAIVAVCTFVYVLLTGLLVYETRKMRQVQTDPKIHITIESFEFAFRLVRLKIQNIGLGPASNLQFDSSIVFGGEPAKKLLDEFTKPNFFRIGLHHFGPGQTIYSGFTQMTECCENKLTSVFLFNIKYKNTTGKQYHQEFPIDMNEIKDSYQISTPLHHIEKSIEKIQKDIHHIASGFKRVNVNTHSSKDRKIEIEEGEKLLAEQKAKHKNL